MTKWVAPLVVAVLANAGASVAQAENLSGARVIVRLRADSALASKQIQDADRAVSLGARTGLALRIKSGPAPGMSAVQASGIGSEGLARLLAAQPDVVYATPDRRKYIRAVPNDPLFDRQWFLQGNEVSAINAQGAWDVTSGSAKVVVAVVDTGVRATHEDLRDRLLPGYDFISNEAVAGDGEGRDADPSDPGDYLTAADLQDPFFKGCGAGAQGDQPTTSSWHGTRVAGVVAATGNNSRGLAGVSWNSKILPLRVLGKCGGFDSDVIAGMRWAGGLAVPGVADNPNPARVVNLSLGSDGACSPAYQEAIDELRSVGVVVVVAAGNSSGAVDEPANCNGAVAVSGLRHVGTKVGYSSAGPEVALAAPAGNCANESGTAACLFQIPTTTNLGQTTPTIDGYSDDLNPAFGTSFSAPLVTGTAALMLSAHPGLGRGAIVDRMIAAVRPFPQQAGLPTCPQADPATGQCNCTTSTCGAGMLDAREAVRAALRPEARFSSQAVDQSVQLDGEASSASTGRKITAWQWRLVDGPVAATFGAPQAGKTGFYASVAGVYRVELSVQDSAGQSDLTQLDVVLSAPSVAPAPTTPPADSGSSGGGGGGGGGGFDFLAVLGLLALAAAARTYRPGRR